MTTKAAENQVYGIISGIAGTWAKVSTVNASKPTTKVSDGGAPEETLFGSKRTFSELTVTRPWDASRDPAIRKDLLNRIGWRTTATVLTVDPDGVTLSTDTYQVGLQSVGSPQGDAQSSNPAEIQLVFAVDGAS